MIATFGTSLFEGIAFAGLTVMLSFWLVLSYRFVRSILPERCPVPGELWISETLGPVWVCDVITPLFVTIIYYKVMTRAGMPTYNMSLSAWRRARFKPVPRIEWDDYLKHGKMP